ncbi:hypothetical protein JOF56_009679 [Kibdelosporangium banguiense]|uniref:DUF5642 domain-containing protein n=1 Tax=Kibdelosporangium banguiense TaxID=1365924 RepID=A0ABS4TY29_9PSEU|nr:hypothetical protein [Kibdelosporangium banguiense]MBP2329294.1 hypothetical protein [Kibdelosporangium banguiense]
MIRLLALPVVVVLAGCSSPVPQPPPPAPPPSAPSAPNGAVGSQALSYMLAPVASRALCGALPPERLQQALGASTIKVTPDPTGLVASCALSASELYVDIRLELDQGFEPTETIAGKPVQALPSSGRITAFDVAIAESVGPAWPDSTQTPILRVGGTGEKVAAPAIRRLIEELVPALAKPADSLPAISPDGTVAFTPVPFTAAGLFDLPTPVQGLRLCSLMKEKFGHEVIGVKAAGDCTVRLPNGTSMDVALAAFTLGVEYDGPKVAGRPASSDEDMFRVRLSDVVQVDLKVAPGNRDVAERLVPLLLQG